MSVYKVLKPCPFCGSGWVDIEHIQDSTACYESRTIILDYHACICNNCGAMVKAEYVEEVIVKWNSRVSEEGCNADVKQDDGKEKDDECIR